MKFNNVLYISFLIGTGQVSATSLMPGLLSDPEKQPFFEEMVPNLLNPAYEYDTNEDTSSCGQQKLGSAAQTSSKGGYYKVWAGDGLQETGHQYDTSSGSCKGRPLAASVNNGPASGLFKVWAGDGLQETGLVDGKGRKLKLQSGDTVPMLNLSLGPAPLLTPLGGKSGQSSG
jgi:hypothetical protein